MMKKENKRKKPLYCIIIALGILVALFNLVPSFAYAMEKIPVVGTMVKIITVRHYFHDKNNELDVTMPKIEYNQEIDETINQDIEKFTEEIMDTFYKEYNEENHASIAVHYAVITNNEKWFTLKLEVSEQMASTNQFFKYYHIDKSKNEIVTLADLFWSEEYKTVLTSYIKEQMAKRMKTDESILYWTEEDFLNDSPFPIKGNQNFYFNEQDNLVIVFNQYEVGPGSIGTPSFEIPKKIYQKYLKEV